jgi:hypothetical protein
MAINGYFIRLAGDDEPKLRKVRAPIYIDPELLPFVDRAVMPEVEREYTEDTDADFEDTLWSSLFLGADYDHDWNDDDRPGVAILADGTRLILEFNDEPKLDDAKSTEEQPRVLAAIEAETLERELAEADSFAPSFCGRNRTNALIPWEAERFTWPHRNYGRKLAKWRIDGKRARKDYNFRWSRRHMQMQMFEQFCVQYDAEQYLDDNARVNTFH